jgi:hypothetical protein
MMEAGSTLKRWAIYTKLHCATLQKVRFQVLTAASKNFSVFWDVAPCSFFETDQRFTGTYCLHHQVDEG